LKASQGLGKSLAYAPALVWAAGVLYIGSRSSVPHVNTKLPIDKVAHFFMYGTLGWLVTWGWLRARVPKRLFIALIFAMGVGAADEIHQRVVPNRSSDFKDWIADALGVTVAATIALKTLSRKHAVSD
jgi:VanZ family protein